MKNVLFWFLIIVGLGIFIFFAGTKPASQEDKNMQETTIEVNGKQWDAPPSMTIDTSKEYMATIVTSKGTIKASLFAKETPKTVNNFVFLANEGFYAGVPFHRIMKGFMVQTGDPTGTGTGGPGYKFEDEPVTRNYTRGTLAMANAGPNTNGSQFFIVHEDAQLPKSYTIFGTIDANDAESLKTLDAIAQTPVTTSPTGEPSMPTETVTIVSVSIDLQ